MENYSYCDLSIVIIIKVKIWKKIQMCEEKKINLVNFEKNQTKNKKLMKNKEWINIEPLKGAPSCFVLKQNSSDFPLK